MESGEVQIANNVAQDMERPQIVKGFGRDRGWWIKTGVSVAAACLVLWWVDWHQFADTLKGANGYLLLVVFVIMHTDRSFMAWKWMMLFRGSGVYVSPGSAMKSYYVGWLWGSFLPTSVGGDVVRGSWLAKRMGNGTIVASSIIIERVLGLVAQAIVTVGSLVLLTIYLDVKWGGLALMVSLLVAMSVIAVLVVFSESTHNVLHKMIRCLSFGRVVDMVEKMRVAILGFKNKSGLLITFVMLSVVEQAFPIISVYTLAMAFSIDLPLVWAVIGVPIILLVSKIPISINAFGIREGAFAFIFSLAGIPVSQSIMMSIADRVLMLLAASPGALWTVSAPNIPRVRGEQQL